MAMSQPYASWVSDPYAPRDPVHSYSQSGQGIRLPPPASLVASRDTDQLASNQPRPSYVYQSAYSPTSSTHVSQPPPLGPPPHHSATTITADQQRRYEQDINQASSSFRYNPNARSQDFQDRRLSSFAPERVISDTRSTPPRYDQRPPGADVRLETSLQSQQQRPSLPPTALRSARSSSPTRVIRPAPETRPDPMRISDLLSNGRRSGGKDVNYKLKIRQQPMAARSCGFGERDRRVIDPPPIVQLIIEGPSLTAEELGARLRYGHYVMSCSIYDESGSHDASFMPEEYRQQRRLMGSLVGAPFVGKDENGEEGCFFCFPDLSCRTPGAFRLKFSLVMIDPIRARELRHFPVLIEAMGEVFTVYNAKDFPGMQASTRLTKRLKEQGCIISIKKGNDKSKNSRALDESDGDQDEGDPSQGKRKRRSVRG
ncbi:Fc.00g111420.m01.CDS01 [Cosmosporella sp. VM-42]